MYPFEFSVVMSVYNVEPYLHESVESLIAQDFGFEKIQLILVDDGSTDESGKICDEYKEQYTNNVVVLHKENGGPSSARNAGIRLATGKYINFMDPDDKISLNTFSSVDSFFQEHEGETDVACIPIYLFGEKKGAHILNYKFKRGTRVIDLDKEWDCIQLSLATSFIAENAAKEYAFVQDNHIAHGEDAIELAKILPHKRTLGVVTKARYHYRKHSGSLLATAKRKKTGYNEYLSKFSLHISSYCQDQFGFIPKFIQFTIMYDLQWNIRQGILPKDVLTSEEIAQYKSKFVECLGFIDDDVILAQKQLPLEFKIHTLALKHQRKAELFQSEKTLLCGYDPLYSFDVLKWPPHLCFFSIQKDSILIEGWIPHFPDFEIEPPKVLACVNEKAYPLETRLLAQRTTSMDETILEKYAFSLRLPLDDETKQFTITFKRETPFGAFCIKRIHHASFFPMDDQYKHAYHYEKGWFMYRSEGGVTLTRKPFLGLVHELRFLAELKREDSPQARKAILSRILVRMLRPLKRRPIWLISDRIMKADDNGEAFFRYIQENHKREVNAFFVISQKSEDYARMKRIGKVVDDHSFKHKLLYLLSDYNISAQADAVTLNPFLGHDRPYRDFYKPRFIFLQHGVTKDDLSGWLNRYAKNFAGFVTTADPEYTSIVEGAYSYSEAVIWKTGFPRFDRLYRDERRQITIMPTWRKNLMTLPDKAGLRQPISSFEESPFFRFYHQLINHPRLLSAAADYGYSIAFFPHPNLQTALEKFTHSAQIKVLSRYTSYREVYAHSDLVVTDYSSAVFDFAYLRKPLIYCQFDSEQFFVGEHVYTKGYFDYERDGFGEVEYDLESTVDRIIEYMKNGCQLKDKYRKRIDNFFSFNDQNNSQRVYEKIMALERQK